MSESIGSVRTMKRKNVKGLALAAPAPRPVAPPENDPIQMPVGDSRQTAQLEIGIEYKLDLRKEDLEVLKELGHGNGGSVSKVRHMATGTVMARKVGIFSKPLCNLLSNTLAGDPCRSEERNAPPNCSRVADYA